MASMTRMVRLGAGLVGLGYGVYRVAKGKNDWLTTTALTTGLSVTLTELAGKRSSPLAAMASTVTQGMPAVSRHIAHAAAQAPHAMANAGWLP